MSLLLIILVLLVLFGGGGLGFYGYRTWGAPGGGLIWLVVAVILIFLLLGHRL